MFDICVKRILVHQRTKLSGSFPSRSVLELKLHTSRSYVFNYLNFVVQTLDLSCLNFYNHQNGFYNHLVIIHKSFT